MLKSSVKDAWVVPMGVPDEGSPVGTWTRAYFRLKNGWTVAYHVEWGYCGAWRRPPFVAESRAPQWPYDIGARTRRELDNFASQVAAYYGVKQAKEVTQ